MEQANYQAYLSSVYPSTTWSLSLLSGGLVNTTMRAIRETGSDSAPKTLILKHARPFVQAGGPELVFSIQRQAVEAAMLDLVHSDEGPSAAMIQDERQAHFPSLLRHDHGTEASLGLTTEDTESSILLLTDFGPLVDCLEYLTARASELVNNDIPATIGATVGKILATLHMTELQSAPDVLHNDLTRDLVFRAAVEPLKGYLEHLSDGLHLYKRVEEDYLSPKYKYPEVLSHGDIHSGSVLIPRDGNDIRPIIIDMEFARLHGRGVNGDVSQFLASVHCGLIAAELEQDAASVAVIASFIRSFCGAYRKGASIMCAMSEGPGSIGIQLMRSCFILHGREIINYAHDVCDTGERRAKMLEVGIWYLEQARDSTEEFLEKANWERMGNEHGTVIQSLFNRKD